MNFRKGDTLKVVDNMDGDEKCEGGLLIDEIVEVTDTAIQSRGFITVSIPRKNGREFQLETFRFVKV
jgi:hypothetical protein